MRRSLRTGGMDSMGTRTGWRLRTVAGLVTSHLGHYRSPCSSSPVAYQGNLFASIPIQADWPPLNIFVVVLEYEKPGYYLC